MIDLAECAIIGGTPNDRLICGTKLRRLGISTFFELSDRKRLKMFKKACQENKWGKGGVYDLDDSEDKEWLGRSDLAQVGV